MPQLSCSAGVSADKLCDLGMADGDCLSDEVERSVGTSANMQCKQTRVLCIVFLLLFLSSRSGRKYIETRLKVAI